MQTAESLPLLVCHQVCILRHLLGRQSINIIYLRLEGAYDPVNFDEQDRPTTTSASVDLLSYIMFYKFQPPSTFLETQHIHFSSNC